MKKAILSFTCLFTLLTQFYSYHTAEHGFLEHDHNDNHCHIIDFFELDQDTLNITPSVTLKPLIESGGIYNLAKNTPDTFFNFTPRSPPYLLI